MGYHDLDPRKRSVLQKEGISQGGNERGERGRGWRWGKSERERRASIRTREGVGKRGEKEEVEKRG